MRQQTPLAIFFLGFVVSVLMQGCTTTTDPNDPDIQVENLRATNAARLLSLETTITALARHKHASGTMTADAASFATTEAVYQATIQSFWTTTPQPTRTPTLTPTATPTGRPAMPPLPTRTSTPVAGLRPGGNTLKQEDGRRPLLYRIAQHPLNGALRAGGSLQGGRSPPRDWHADQCSERMDRSRPASDRCWPHLLHRAHAAAVAAVTQRRRG